MCVADEAQDARTDLQTNAEIAAKHRHRSTRNFRAADLPSCGVRACILTSSFAAHRRVLFSNFVSGTI